ncbi:hypothetical protein SH1V18_07120 [Vallitalea longa]|uniref:Uncharacterized protein n=1 Tax=Vallitalea longa TaxID=2936439 RepID=A0A9W6DEB1_9FIRM|nr:ABC transporter substrate-binding protein [Vallitalea longa]GKX28232.1 hypothetical protein SH1V18_07120 [Vallitalea longa]
MKKIITLLLTVTMIFSLAACSNGNKKDTDNEKVTTNETSTEDNLVEITVPTYRSGENVGALFFEPQVQRFNEEYKGQYKINIEESPSDTHNDKIKQLALSNKLPALVQMSDNVWIEEFIVKNKKYYDLSSWLESKPEVKKLLVPESLEYNTQEDGSIVSLPLTVVRPIGLYYNTDMFKPSKKISEMNFDEFAEEFKGNKLAFQTTEGAWTISLWLDAMIASEEGGAEVLKAGVENKLNDFNTDLWVKAFTDLKKWYDDYGFEGTIGASYPDAANSFMSGKTALIPNGTWMVSDFSINNKDNWSNGFDGANIDCDIYPNNIALANSSVYDWFIPIDTPEDERECALAFLEFISTPEEIEAYMLAEGGSSPMLEYSEEYKSKLAENKLLNQLSESINSETILVPHFIDVISEATMNEFSKLLPKLFDGSYTPEQFCAEFTKKAQENLD